MRKAYILYMADSVGVYHKQYEASVDIVDRIQDIYAYDKRSQTLYVRTSNSNCAVKLTPEYARIFKKDKNIPHLKGEELLRRIEDNNSILDEFYTRVNSQRVQFINDSIVRACEAELERARQDSIARVERARRDSLARIAEENRLANYRRTHDWRWVPISRQRLSCSLCSNTISDKDSILCMAATSDTLYYITMEQGALGLTFLKSHAAPITASLRSAQRYSYHYNAFRDSLQNGNITSAYIEDFNFACFHRFLQQLREIAPNGFVEQWSWNNRYSNITLYLTYFNTNQKTIRYIEVHFKVTNDVGDVRKTGFFRGTGPVNFLNSGTWDWDSSRYYVAGDATSMELTKIVITYMDGTRRTINKNQIKYN
ncbi:MAG: hypothetical protein K6A98_02775 [Prevotella sp.]|nr:hypothetical protein [Prevotella sp.]